MSCEIIPIIKNNSSLYSKFITNAVNASPNVQKNFLNVTKNVAETIKKILIDADLIINLDYEPSNFWNINKNKTACFVDGGVDKCSIMSAAPLSIRAGSYIVNPSSELGKRELFEESMVFLGDLYDAKNDLYELETDDFEEDQMLNKKKDGARIIFEAATLVKHILLKRDFDYCFLHGPIEATIMPFTVKGFPSFTKFAVENIIPVYDKQKINNNDSRHFINVYLECVKLINKSHFPIYGIVETSTSAPYIKNLLFKYRGNKIISETDFRKILSTIKKYKITDSNLFEIILKKNQALKPLIIKKQISGFNVTSGSQWEDKMDLFPNVSIGYIKVSDNQSPIRIESLQNPVNLKKDYEYILATSKLLPNYGFPVGLSVVDKFAKIPNWMGKASRNYYTTYFLKEAIKQKNPNTISVALKVLSKSNRSWLTRPTMRRFK